MVEAQPGYGIAAFERPTQPLSPEARVALDVLGPCYGLTNKIRDRFGWDLPENDPKARSETQLPEGVVAASDHADKDDATVGRLARRAKRFITIDDEHSLLQMSAEGGVDRAEDVTLQQVNLPPNVTQTGEGGKFGKMAAQKSKMLGDPISGEASPVAVADEEEPTGIMAQCATKTRDLEAGSEAESVAAMVQGNLSQIEHSTHLLDYLEVNPDGPFTEYDAAVLLWVTDPRFVPATQPRVVGHVTAYGVPGGAAEGRFAPNQVGAVGDLVEIGFINGRKVLIQDVPREYTYSSPGVLALTSKGAPKYKQPNASELALAHAKLLGHDSGAVVTSARYLLEHIVEAAKVAYVAAKRGDPPIRVVPTAYGTSRMESVTGTEPEKMSLAHILGAIGKAHRLSKALYEDIMADELLPA